MKTEKPNPFDGYASWTPPAELMELDLSPREVLAELIHESSPDPTVRSAATAAFVLSLWQLGGNRLTPESPSFFLIHAGADKTNPVDEWVKGLVYDEKETKPGVQRTGPFMNGSVELAPKAMQNAMRNRMAIQPKSLTEELIFKKDAENYEKRFHAARVTAFGHARCQRYSKGWHPEYGLLTERNNRIILRLNDNEDRNGFCEDALKAPMKLIAPTGVGPQLSEVQKGLCLSGSLTLDQWQEELALHTLNLGLPIFPLVHPADATFEPKHLHALAYFVDRWRSAPLSPVPTRLRLPYLDGVADDHNALRKRLALLPRPTEFPVLQVLHQLEGVCDLIVRLACEPTTPINEAVALFQDLYSNTLRAFVIGFASQSFFLRNLPLGPHCEPMRKKAVKLLQQLRRGEVVKKSIWSKNNHITAGQRDTLLDQLTKDNLIRVEGDSLVATTYPEFLTGLSAREKLPPLTNHWKAARAQRETKEPASSLA